MPETQFLSAALALAELGYKVFPLSPGTKVPRPGSRGLLDATSDPTSIEAWWSAVPDANIGLLTDDLAVIDADNHAWPTEEALARELATGLVQRTPRGGRHYVFRQPPGASVRCSAGKVAEGVDVRANGGYIVAAPSIVEGKRYELVSGDWSDMPVLPSSILALIDRPATWQIAKPAEPGNVIAEGGRNDALFRMGCRMRQTGHTKDEIAAALLQTNRDRCRPPQSPSEVHKIAEQAARYEPDQIRTMVVEGHEDPLSPSGPVVVRLSEVAPMPVEWLWPGRIAVGKLTLIAGDPGLGKSFLTLDLAARKSAGKPWPDSPRLANPAGAVVLLSAEDDLADTIRPRLDAAGADVSRIVAIQGISVGSGNVRTFNFESDLAYLETTINQTPGCQLVVVDPISAYIGEKDSHKNAAMRGLLSPLTKLAERTRVGIVAVTHLNKGAGGPALYRATGSLAFIAAARAGWVVAKDKGDARRRLFLPVKNNLAEDVSGLAFKIESGRVEWESQPVSVTADDALAIEQATGEATGDRHAVVDWLSQLLAAGPMPQKDIADAASGHGFTMSQVRRAKQRLGVEARREGGLGGKGHWVWFVPGYAIAAAVKASVDDTQGATFPVPKTLAS